MLLFGTKARDVFKAWAKSDKEAQTEAVKRLGLPANNTAADRAKAMSFGDTQYHGTKFDFNGFKDGRGKLPLKAHFVTPEPKISDFFAGLNTSAEDGIDALTPKIMPLRTRGNIFDYENPEHLSVLKKEIGTLDDGVGKGHWQEIESSKVQKAIRELGFDGFKATEDLQSSWTKIKNTGVYNASDIRSPLAHFNPKMAGIGAGSVLSADLMADESNTKPTESIWSSLMNTIGNVNQQQAQGAADIGAKAMEGTAGLAKMLVTQPDVVAETVGGGLLKAAGVVSPWIKGAGLGALLYPSELGDGTLRDESGEYHPHVKQFKQEQQLDEYIASLTPDIHSTEIRLGR